MSLFSKKQNQYPVVASNSGNQIFALDIGSRKIRLVSGIVDNNNLTITVTGYQEIQSRGVKNGTVADPQLLANTIADLISTFQQKFNVEIKSIVTNVCGCYIKSGSGEGQTTVQNNQITAFDRNAAIKDAQDSVSNINLNEYSIVQIIPQEYESGSNKNLINPIGLYARKLVAKVHFIACNKIYLKNVDMIIRNVSNTIESTSIVFDGNAAASLVLRDSDKELGCLLVDIGASTTTITLFAERNQKLSFGISEGGDFITKYIASSLRIDMREAEYIKIKYGQANPKRLENSDQASDDVMYELRQTNPSLPVISRTDLSRLISQAVYEMFTSILRELENKIDNREKNKIKYKLDAGVVLVGGGSHLKDIANLVEWVIFKNNESNKYSQVKISPKAKLGLPIGVKAYNSALERPEELNYPDKAVALGIIRSHIADNPNQFSKTDGIGYSSGPGIGSKINAMKNWIKREVF